MLLLSNSVYRLPTKMACYQGNQLLVWSFGNCRYKFLPLFSNFYVLLLALMWRFKGECVWTPLQCLGILPQRLRRPDTSLVSLCHSWTVLLCQQCICGWLEQIISCLVVLFLPQEGADSFGPSFRSRMRGPRCPHTHTDTPRSVWVLCGTPSRWRPEWPVLAGEGYIM